MGAYGVYSALSRFPHVFAAGVPLCGALSPWSSPMLSTALVLWIKGYRTGTPGRPAVEGVSREGAQKAAAVPLWAFHGAWDIVVPASAARRAVQTLVSAGSSTANSPRQRITVYRGAGHQVWHRALKSPALFAWLLAQRKGDAKAALASPARPLTDLGDLANLADLNLADLTVGPTPPSIDAIALPYTPESASSHSEKDAPADAPPEPEPDVPPRSATHDNNVPDPLAGMSVGGTTDDPTVDFRTRHGWRMPGLVQRMSRAFEAHAAALDQLPIEGATPAELAKVDELRAALLHRRGLAAPPAGWHAQHYSRARLVHYLRAKNGRVDEACEYVTRSIDVLDAILDKASAHEAASALEHELADRVTPLGFYGLDRRGASVCYYKVCNRAPPTASYPSL